jgi:hypothetical protein
MTKEEYIALTGQEPEEQFGENWEEVLNEDYDGFPIDG